MTAVVGLDPSLTATGIATPDGQTTISTSDRGMARLDHIVTSILGWCSMTSPDLVVIEGYSYGSPNQAAHLGELGGVVRLELWRLRITYIDVPPSTLKVFATGKGNAGKDEVLASAIRRLRYAGHDHNQADALWLRAFGHHLLDDPLVELPATHTRAVDKVRPNLEGTPA